MAIFCYVSVEACGSVQLKCKASSEVVVPPFFLPYLPVAVPDAGGVLQLGTAQLVLNGKPPERSEHCGFFCFAGLQASFFR